MKKDRIKMLMAGALLLFAPALIHGQEGAKKPQPGTKLTDDQIKQWVAPLRSGRKMTPKNWPNGAKVAVCLSWDMDMETFDIAAGIDRQVQLSQGEYGTTEGLPRIMALYDK